MVVGLAGSVLLACSQTSPEPAEASSADSPDQTGIPDAEDATSGQTTTIFRVRKARAGGFGDADDNHVIWKSSVSAGHPREAIWHVKIGKSGAVKGSQERLWLLDRGRLSGNLSTSIGYAAWVEYDERAINEGKWWIRLHDFRTDSNHVVRDWSDTGLGKGQPIPSVSMDDGLLAWTEGRRLPEGKRICIVTLDIQGDQRSSHCAPDRSIFRDMTVVNNDTIAYTETSTAESPSSRPAVLGRPELEEALPQPWELRTRSVEADSEGVAWVANSPEYGGPAATYYWSDETGLLEMPAEDPTFPAQKVGLLNEAVLWMETEYANQIFAVRRELVGCEAAVRGVVPRKLRQGSMSVLLAGTGGGRVMSIIFESDGSAHIALVPLPELPTAC